MTIRSKLLLIGLIIFVGMIVMGSFTLQALTHSMRQDHQRNVRQQVETAYGILAHYQAQVIAGQLSDEQARTAALQTIQALRYGNNDYFWINDMQPRMVMHPIKPELNGKDVHDIKDANGVYLFTEFVRRVQQDGGAGFVDYLWPKPGQELPQQKISYVKAFAPWGWIIGSGIYVDDVQQAFWNNARNLLWQGLLLLAILVASTWPVVRRIVSNIRQAATLAAAIAGGKLDNPVFVSSLDETGDLLRELERMQRQLSERIEQEQRVAAEHARISYALQQVQSPVTLMDQQHQLIFRNEAAQQLFKQLVMQAPLETREHLHRRLQDGQLLDCIPDHQAHHLFRSELKETRVLDIQAWGQTVKMIVTPVLDAQGHHQGQITQWQDITEKLAEQQREEARIAEERQVAATNLRLRVALDNVSASLMVTDASHQIIYLNNAAVRMFSAAEADIRRDIPGFLAQRIVGSHIDLFHKNPEHQHRLLEHLQSAHQSSIVIGGHSIRFVANPVRDAQDHRLGTVVEWTDRTTEVAVEREIDAIVNAAHAGDLSQRIDLRDKTGFFHGLAQGINALIDEMEHVFNDIAGVMSHLSQGNLAQSMAGNYQGTFGRVKEDINTTVTHLAEVVQQLRENADFIATSAGEIASGNNNLNARTEQQAASLEEAASSMEQLTSTVRNNAANAQQANQLADIARLKAEQGGLVVHRAVDAMNAINSASGKIAEIIGVIDEIAFQTNLLALNASVEAARAGEQGRGFAVVATEVRNLASRSASAAKDIKELIRDSADKVKLGAALVNESGATLEDIVVAVKRVGGIVAEIAAASAEQSSGIEQVNRTVTELDEVTQQNAALAEQTSSASAALNDKARNLHQVIGFFATSADTPQFHSRPRR